MGRRLFNFMSAVSLLILVLACSAWFQARGRGDFAYVRCHKLGLSITTQAGHLQLRAVWFQGGSLFESPPPFNSTLLDGERENVRKWIAGISLENPLIIDWTTSPNDRFCAGSGSDFYSGLRTMPSPPDYRYWYVFGPWWFAITILGLLPACWLACKLRSRCLPTPESCPACGYDLRATPDRCPECGRVSVQDDG